MNRRMLVYILNELIAIKAMLDGCQDQAKLTAHIDAAILEARSCVTKHKQ